MKLLSAPRQPFVGLAMAAGVGILVAEFIPASKPLLGAMAVGVALWILVTLWQPVPVATYLIVAISFFLLHNFRTTDTAGLRLAAQLGERPRLVVVTGTVVSEPKIWPNRFASFLLKLDSIDFAGQHEFTTATWSVTWRGRAKFGDELKLSGIAKPIAPPRNPGQFDMRTYLAQRDVHRELFVRSEENGVLLRHGRGNPVLRAAQRSRHWLQAALCRGLEDSPDVQSFLSGIVLGLRRQTQQDIEEPFQQTGTLHLFAVAGLHVGIFAELLWILAMVGRLSRKWAATFIIPALFFYAAVTGLHVSSVRAAIMASILLGGIFFDRKVFLLNSLAAAAFVLFCWDTNELFDIGFQLSFAVVGAIVVFADPLFGLFKRLAAPDPFLPRTLLRGSRRWSHLCFEWFCGGVAVSLAAWAGSAAFIGWHFHLVTPISLLANLLVVPIAFFVLAVALLSLLTAPLTPWLSVIFNNANWSLAQLVLGIVHVLSQVPGGHFYVDHPHWPKLIVARITVLDMGAGAAVHVRTQSGDWLFDCGSKREYKRVLLEYLHSSGVNQLEGLLLSHGDSLHIGGAQRLLHDFPWMRLIDNPLPDRSSTHRQLLRLFRQRHLHPDKLTAGERLQLSPTVTAKILHPPQSLAATKTDDQAYVVQLFVKPATSIMFLSDSGEETERRLLTSGENLRSDILVKGQHHSARSGCDEFLNAVQPKLIIATSRDFPEEERISDEWAAKVQSRGIKLFRQDETGAVIMRCGPHAWEARSYITGETFRSSSR